MDASPSREDRGGWARWLAGLEPEGRAGAPVLDRIAWQVLDRAAIRAGDTVADLGSGTGLLTLIAARLTGPSGRVIALDGSAECLRVLAARARDRGLANVTGIQADLTELPVESGSVDAVACRSALAYSSDLASALREIRRILVPRGRFSVFEPLIAESGWDTGGWLGPGREDFLELERALLNARGTSALDRHSLRQAFDSAGFDDHQSLPVRFTVNMSARSQEDVLQEYLFDLPGELSASKLLTGVFSEEILERTVRSFAREACAGRVAGWLWCLFIWGRRR